MNRFVPFLWVLGERNIGEPIFMVAIFGEDHFRLVPLPRRITKLPPDVELKLVVFVARTHFKRNNGVISCFGRILGYVYCRSSEERWTLSPSGEVINRTAPAVRRGKYTLTLKNRPHQDISFIFRRRRPN